MATSGKIVDWETIQKSLISGSQSSFLASDIPPLINAILDSSKEILNHDDKYENFYSCFVALSAHYIAEQSSILPRSLLGKVSAACHTLMAFSLDRMLRYKDACSVSQRNLMSVVEGLCTGSGQLQRSSVVTFTALLKTAKIPSSGKQKTKGEATSTVSVQVQKPPQTTPIQFVSQLMSSFQDTGSTRADVKSDLTSVKDQKESDTSKQFFISKNIDNLHSLHGTDTLLDVCLNLPFLQRYINSYHEAVSGLELTLPKNSSDSATMRASFSSLLNAMTIVSRVLALPTLEVMTPQHLEKVTTVIMSCLYAAISAATASLILSSVAYQPPKGATPTTIKEEDQENMAIMVVQKGLALFETLMKQIKKSTRSAGHHLQNLQMLGAWCVLRGLQYMMNLDMTAMAEVPAGRESKTSLPKTSPASKGKDSPPPIKVSSKSTPPFGCLTVALSDFALICLNHLLDDFHLETLGQSFRPTNIQPATPDILEQFTASQRILLILKNVSLPSLLLTLSTRAYFKSCDILKVRMEQEKALAESDTGSLHDGSADEGPSSEESSDDDDSEPILGPWFEEAISEPKPLPQADVVPPPAPTLSGTNQEEAKSTDKKDETTLLEGSEKEEMTQCLKLSSEILNFLTSFLVKFNTVLQSLSKSIVQTSLIWTNKHIKNLAEVIQDMDSNEIKMGDSSLMDEFSSALVQLCHGVLSSGTFMPEQQNVLLTSLNVNIKDSSPWPLYIPPRSLAVMAHIYMSKLQQVQGITEVKQIWDKFLDSLNERMLSGQNLKENDANVEHVQFLVFLFDFLQSSDRADIFRRCAEMLISASKSSELTTRSPLPVVRLLLIFEYLLFHFSLPAPQLYEQVQWNIFSVQSTDPSLLLYQEEKGGIARTKFYHECVEIEENISQAQSSGGAETLNKLDLQALKRCFYSLVAKASEKDMSGLDKEACEVLYDANFDYNELYQALIQLQASGAECDVAARKTGQTVKYPLACVLHYSHLICWRVLGHLAPSVAYLKLLEGQQSGKERELDEWEILHTLRWVPRISAEKYREWIKEHLYEQRLPTTEVDSLMKIVVKHCNNPNFDITLTKKAVLSQLGKLPVETEDLNILNLSELPGSTSICLMDVVVAKLQVTLRELAKKGSGKIDADTCDEVEVILLTLMRTLTMISRPCLLYDITEGTTEQLLTPISRSAYSTLFSILSSYASELQGRTCDLKGTLSDSLKEKVDKWNQNTTGFISPETLMGKTEPITAESYMNKILSLHLNSLSKSAVFSVTPSLKYLMFYLISLISDLRELCPQTADSKERIVTTFLPLLLDASTEHLHQSVSEMVPKVLGALDSQEVQIRMYRYIFRVAFTFIRKFCDSRSQLEEKTFQECLQIAFNALDQDNGGKALRMYFEEDGDISDLYIAAAKPYLSDFFAGLAIAFFVKVMQTLETHQENTDLVGLVAIIGVQSLECTDQIQYWLTSVVHDGPRTQEYKEMLLTLAKSLQDDKSDHGETFELLARAFLTAMIPMSTSLLTCQLLNCLSFAELMPVMTTLAGVGSGDSHNDLFQASHEWLKTCRDYLSQKDVIEKLQNGKTDGKHQQIMESTCYIISYIADILATLKQSTERPSVLAYDTDATCMEVDSDWTEDLAVDDDDSGGEDSDEDSLCNKLCTFTLTQKVFMNQHWYHCHTCKMVDGVGVCTICAKVCHKGHELSYAKYGSFFCDCGAKEDGSCMALVKRTPGSNIEGSMSSTSTPPPFSSGGGQQSSDRDKNTNTTGKNKTQATISLASPTEKPENCTKGEVKGATITAEERAKFRKTLTKKLEKNRSAILEFVEAQNPSGQILPLLESLMPAIEEHYNQTSAVGTTSRAQKALSSLHSLQKTVEATDQLMVPTLGSQEGAFENVRANYSGDQGQTIRQLLGAHMLHRVAMCCLASPYGRRQHLAVCHEKGRITVLQLSALLKQADSSKRKLTLTRLSQATVPFSILSITGNPCNEDFLAVCGLKDCHVLTFTGSGSVSDQLVLHCQLEAGNFIIKALWLPGSQTELAIVTADFVKIYDLSKDAISPQFYFLVPSGKIRDACFIFTEESRNLILMSSAGYMYSQLMEEASEARHGPFYVTNVLEAKHSDLKDVNGQVAGGGVSCYYSHTLQLLFFSYTHGKSFCAAVNQEDGVFGSINPFPITLKNNGGKSGNPPPLCQWSEVALHPGLVCCLTQTNSIPVVLMVEPDKIKVQEIKTLSAKAKVQDMVAIRHSASSDQQRTTLILLCEDGSLRIYMANVDNTGYWMSQQFQAPGAISILKPAKKKKVVKTGRPTGQITFPVDFFETCQAINEIEFGGNDLLQIYNTQQIKHRLNTTGMYVASTKAGGFSIEVHNNNASMVMVGVRVHMGTQSIERTPSFLEIFGRVTQVHLTRNRWYDLAFTREESLTADKKFTLYVGPSVDPDGVTMVDSIKIYGKTKESFNWDDDTGEDFATTATPATAPITSNSGSSSESEIITSTPVQMTSLDKMVSSSIEVLDGVVNLTKAQEDVTRDTIMELATSLLTMPTPPIIQQHVKALLTAVQPNSTAYHNHKDQAQVGHVIQCLNAMTPQHGAAVAVPAPSCELDPEAYQRLVVTARSVAVSRPRNLVTFADADPDVTIQSQNDLTQESRTQSSSLVDSEVPPAVMSSKATLEPDETESQHFLTRLVDTFWRLHASKPKNPMLAPACLPGLTHIEVTVGALVEIIYAFATRDFSIISLATKLFMRLLLSEDISVSFAAKQALIRVTHPHKKERDIPSPPRCSSPSPDQGGPEDDEGEDKGPQDMDMLESSLAANDPEPSINEESYEVVGQADEMELEEPGDSEPEMPVNGAPGGGANALPLEALLGGRGGFPPMLDIPPDADDEAMMELAIALSLQEQSSNSNSPLNLQGLGLSAAPSGSAAQGQSTSSLETGTLSDTTASAASDDEGSTAATDGSTLRTSPAEHAGSAESESGASMVDSITGEHSVSGRSSAYGDGLPDSTTVRPESISDGGVTGSGIGPTDSCEISETDDADNVQRLHMLRLLLLERLLQYMPELRDVGGVRAIPYMQVVLMLSSDLDLEEDKDREALDHLLITVMNELEMEQSDFKDVAERTPRHEVQLIVMRLLSVFMSRTKSGTKAASESSTQISHATASALLKCDAVDHCLRILKSLLEHWLEVGTEEEGTSPGSNLLKGHPPSSPPDMSPFFLRQYVKGHAGDVFEAYPQLLTEMVLRLPYQIKKICDTSPSVGQPVFDQAWFYFLCEYMMTQQTPFVRRQVRKLLLFICGTKDKYRQLRDLHALESHLKDIKKICSDNGLNLADTDENPLTLPYDTVIQLIEHLKSCQEMATSRTLNWQKFCHKDDTVLPNLLKASLYLDVGVAPLLLQLLACALCGSKAAKSSSSQSSTSSTKTKKEKEKDRSEDSSEEIQRHDEVLCQALIKSLTKSVGTNMLARFIRHHLLESNNTLLRWQAHSLILHIFKSSPNSQKEIILELMWDLWPELSNYGRKAAQFVDLLGYFSLKVPQGTDKAVHFVQKAAALLKTQNQTLTNHPNSTIYNELAGLVAFDGYYLESDPCLVCNNPEIPFTNIKLTALKVDSRYTANSQIVKLVGTHTISKIILRISDIKRTKMVRTINLYYNNRTVHSVVDLKNKPTVWHKAKKCNLTAGQTEVKVEFTLPIVAANLMIEYSDFYDNLSASAETLQCPRCSASVPANPGVCGNCGENVFQCHKCRAINYDEKDPFLCNSCGFCKYAKFDYNLTARACCAVDPIENEEDRQKATSTINSLLEKADRVYRQLVAHRPQLEVLISKVQEPGFERSQDEGPSATTNAATSASSTSTATVNKAIQLLAQRYCGDCKGTFEELSKIIQKVLACRKELVDYDRRQREASQRASLPHSGMTPLTSPLPSPHPSPSPSSIAVAVPGCTMTDRNAGRCYGCAAAATEHCITLLRALATNPQTRVILVNQGLIHELVEYNLRTGQSSYRGEVHQLLFLLTKDNSAATQILNDILMTRITSAIKDNVNVDLAGNIRHLMNLLMSTCTVKRYDSCWEQRLQCIVKLFLMSVKMKSPVVMETITLPCLKVLNHMIKPPLPKSKKNKEETIENLSTVRPVGLDVYINTNDWLNHRSSMYEVWKQRVPANEQKEEKQIPAEAVRGKYLMQKYARRWMEGTKKSPDSINLGGTTWLRRVLFSPSSPSARKVACNIVDSICQVSSRRQKMLDLLTSFLDEIGPSGESAFEFIMLYQSLIGAPHWKLYLAAKGVLPHITDLITKEIEVLSTLEDTTLTSDLSQGYALKMLADLLSSFLEVDAIRRHYKGKLLGPVLHGYLALRKLVVQRTKLVDETQQMLLDLLEDMTTGTESETRDFMRVCVETVKQYQLDDLRTPVFIFERLCSIIFPEENEVAEFFMTLEKDPQQEEFLQGRMQGNPYSSNEADLGPTMRDVKNKICRDCELIALLEDDTGMELLVNNKIISLDLPVKDVYKRIWCPDNEGEPMRIIYRMRGLLGDATEEFIENLKNPTDEESDDEEVYKMANVMSECDGMEVMLHRLAHLTDLVRGRQLLNVLLKLLGFCVRVKVNRQKLLNPNMQAVNIMMAVLNRVLLAENGNPGAGGGASTAEQVLIIMEAILLEAINEPVQKGQPHVMLACDKSQLRALLDRANSPFVRSQSNVLQGLMRIIPFLSFGDVEKMQLLIKFFQPYMDFEKFDDSHTQDEKLHLECFCAIAAGIENSSNGERLKDLIFAEGVVGSAVKYITANLPKAANLESPPWKEFLSKPALPFVLRLLTGLSKDHARTQEYVGYQCTSAIHRLEQISSDEGIGSLAENLMESLKSNPKVAKKIDEVRALTKAEKKKLAMAMRMKQLGALGMSTNDKGQVTAKSSAFQQMEELVEETGLTCCICREGYKYQSQKVLGIYTFTKVAVLEPFENKNRKTQGYSTVSHFNIVHYDCHLAAVRHARGREEWESAVLQNANTKCNGLLPLWGPQVPESAFASCLARHNVYLPECSGYREPTYHATLHDLKLLLLRYAEEKSFSDDSGGGAKQSNMHLIPYLIHMALYVINTTRCVPREEKNITTFLKHPPAKWVELAYELDGPYYHTLLALHVLSHKKWKENRLTFLKQLIVCSQARTVSASPTTSISDKRVKDYTVYKSGVMFFGLIEIMYQKVFKDVLKEDSSWSQSLATYIRNNDEALLKATDKALSMFLEEYLPCESFGEFCDVAGLLEEIPDPEKFLRDVVKSI